MDSDPRVEENAGAEGVILLFETFIVGDLSGSRSALFLEMTCTVASIAR